MCFADTAAEKMDEMPVESSKVDAVLHGVTFYPRSSDHTASHLKAVPDAQIKAATHTHSSSTSHDVSFGKKTQKTINQSNRSIGASKSKVLERRPKSIESLRLTNANCKLIRKPKYTLLPYKRGQLKFCTNYLGNAVVRKRADGALDSELAAEKENKMDSVGCGSHVVTEKLNVNAGASRRFFKANLGNRRKFTLNVCRVPGNRTKPKHLKRHDRNKLLCINAASDNANPESGAEAIEDSRQNDVSAVCDVGLTLSENVTHKKPDVTVEAAEVTDDNNQAASNAEFNDSVCFTDVEQHSDTTSTSDAASVVMSTPQLYSETLVVTSPSSKRGIFLCFYSVLSFSISQHQLFWNYSELVLVLVLYLAS